MVAFAASPLAAAPAEEKGAVETEIIQQAEADPTAVRYGEAIATRYKVGAKVTAKGGTVRNIRLMVAVPLECPEQEVHVLEEDYSPHVTSVNFRNLPEDKRAEAGARQMLITIAELPPRQVAQAIITYEVITKTMLPPEETATLKLPAKPDRTLKPYLSASPYINVNHRKIREAVNEALEAPEKNEKIASDDGDATGEPSPGDEQPQEAESAAESAYEEVEPTSAEVADEQPSATAAEIDPEAEAKESDETAQEEPGGLVGVDAAGSFAPADSTAGEPEAASSAPGEPTGDWQRVEKLYDYVIDKVKYEEGAQDKPALKALQDEKGDCHGIAALFVAMCRTADVPARMVWVDGHQYAEFYLENAEGKGHWYPVQSAGTRAFGEMPTPKVILQKGDNFRVPERRRERLRYASDYTLLLAEPRFKPKVTYIREQL
jgi:transglutaminase-like putative cysteine protease